jgi:hypothetical protein
MPLKSIIAGGFVDVPGASSSFGVVRQVVAVVPMTSTATGNATSYSDEYTGVINVQSTTSRVICIVSGFGSAQAGGWDGMVQLTGGGTPLVAGAAAGNRATCHAALSASGVDVGQPFTLIGSDAPGVTGNRTYALQLRSTNAAGPWFLNRVQSDTDNVDIPRGATTMFLVEYEPNS